MGFEAAVIGGRDEDRCGIGQGDHLRVAHPVGLKDEHLIPGLQACLEEIVEAVLRPAGDQNFLRGVAEAVLPRELLHDRGP